MCFKPSTSLKKGRDESNYAWTEQVFSYCIWDRLFSCSLSSFSSQIFIDFFCFSTILLKSFYSPPFIFITFSASPILPQCWFPRFHQTFSLLIQFPLVSRTNPLYLTPFSSLTVFWPYHRRSHKFPSIDGEFSCKTQSSQNQRQLHYKLSNWQLIFQWCFRLFSRWTGTPFHRQFTLFILTSKILSIQFLRSSFMK